MLKMVRKYIVGGVVLFVGLGVTETVPVFDSAYSGREPVW
jgi:hypothetical protein